MRRFSMRELAFSRDPEAVIRAHYEEVIAGARNSRARAAAWSPGRPLRLLLAGYSGALNTGADVRTYEIVRQLRTLLGPEQLELGVVAIKPAVPPAFAVQYVELLDRHPAEFVADVCDRYDGVIACEGSLFTSTFSDALAAMLTACLACAVAQRKPAIAIGAEADFMTPPMEAFVRRHGCGIALYSRNETSRRRLVALGLAAHPGTDTGWSFAPDGTEHAADLLRNHGWDGDAEIVALCPVDPFRWPLATDFRRLLLLPLSGGADDSHYGGFHFHKIDEERRARFAAYLDAIAAAVISYGRRHRIFPIVIGMEPLDRHACLALAERLGSAPSWVAGDHDAHRLVTLLRAADRLISSRLHAILLTMAAGVPAIGLGYDQRIRRLLEEAAQSDMHLRVDDADLSVSIEERLDVLHRETEGRRERLQSFAARQLRRQAEMGHLVRADLVRAYPAFPFPSEPASWRACLPPLAGEIQALAERAEKLPRP